MGALSAKLRNAQDGGLLFYCPGCASAHQIKFGAGSGPRWSWNGDALRPTFWPSVLVRYSNPADPYAELGASTEPPAPDVVCHSFVRDGLIEFLADCTHPLAGQTVELPDWPRRLDD